MQVHYLKGEQMLDKNIIIERINRKIEGDLVANTLIQALKHKYQSIYSHCVNVAVSSYFLAQKMGLSDERCLQIGIGGMLHDIGKLNIPSKILYKRGELTRQERAIIERHPIIGVSLLNQSSLLPGCIQCVLSHHERIDGAGYGAGLTGEMIPLEAKIISVCEAFDVLVSYRQNQRKLTLGEACNEIKKGINSHFDSAVGKAFLVVVEQVYHKISGVNENDNTPAKELVTDKQVKRIDWEALLGNIQDVGVIFVNQTDTIAYCNEASAVIRARKKEEMLGSKFAGFHKKHRHDIVLAKLNDVKNGRSNGWNRIMKRGEKYISNEYIAIRNKDGSYQGLLMFSRDVTEKENVLRLLEKDIENLNILVQSNGLLNGIFGMDEIYEKAQYVFGQAIDLKNLSIILNTRGTTTVLGIETNQKQAVECLIGEILSDPGHPSYSDVAFHHLGLEAFLIGAYQVDQYNKAVILLQVDEAYELDTNLSRIIMTIGSYVINAIQKKRLVDEIRENARIDNLTQVFNREYFQMMLDSIDTQNENVGVIVADIDNLKFYNDTYGHLVGDEVIKKTAGILKSTIRSEDYLFRIGGDEFLILLRNCNEEDARNTCRRIQKNIGERSNESTERIKLGISVGFHISNHTVSMNEVIKIADENMYKNKQEGKQRYLS